MTKRARRKIDAALKAKIALEAVRGQASVNELAQHRQVHPNRGRSSCGISDPRLRPRRRQASGHGQGARDRAASRQGLSSGLTRGSGSGWWSGAVMDWSSRAVLSWRLSNTMDTSFCLEALEEALARFGKASTSSAGDLQHRPRQPVHRARPSPEPSNGLASASRWTGAVVSSTTFSSSGCGAR